MRSEEKRREEKRREEKRREEMNHLPPATMSKVLSPFSSHGTKAQQVYTFAAVPFDCVSDRKVCRDYTYKFIKGNGGKPIGGISACVFTRKISIVLEISG
jgi:hypothetical protein